ncbi:hypothetical protein LshimejAT787_3900020 [Lyophyllum shimeji]|uniref:Uncharacterized protein n=1 Tax=Lyophyllum shimeji TaxID=47721 RepID=A0A9P3UXA1_LYOSH|nr:hypothetical protein LshimejAT787_3900020 [Lyophyllum shimeji]
MATELHSAKFTELFDSLPPEAQRTLLENHIFPLLDSLSSEKSDHALSVAEEYQTRLRSRPRIDLKNKQKEVNGLLDALNKDSKVTITKESSNREELLAEVVDSLTGWLSDIWSTVYEFREHYSLAHACLLFAADVSSSLVDMPVPGGCKCSLLNMPIDITIRRQDGKVVKSFTLRGPQAMGKALLWLWRELFVSLSAYGTALTKKKMPEMIEDIESVTGWESLERLLYGGGASTVNMEYEDLDDDQDDILDIAEDDGDEDYVDDGDDEETCRDDELGGGRCFCSYHANHWTPVINEQRIHLRELVEDRLHAKFRTMPSLPLYNVIHAISPDYSKTQQLLLQELNENATKSSETFAAALSIYTNTANTQRIVSLLSTHFHLLRPRDTEIWETELLEAVRAIRAAVTSVFGNIDTEVHKEDLEAILALRLNSPERQERIHRWVDGVVTSVPHLSTMALAAMMMGFPVADEGGQVDISSFLDDVEPRDRDWDELKEEFRPPLKERFEGWCRVAGNFKDPTIQTALEKIYYKTVELMPFMRSSDITDHMILKLTELPGKGHIVRGLQALSSWCVLKRKHINSAAKQQRRTGKKAGATPAQNTAPGPMGSTSAFSFSFPSPAPPTAPHPPFGGMEDVD